ncbi:MAG: hypothetical protein IPI01_17540 [Ignavibacteriae bacterium]|nr:hypothetical protein [Ignavibacteriota bacterium]
MSGIELPGQETPARCQGRSIGPVQRSGRWPAGYGVVTPLQLVMAYAALANKGVLLKPFVVRKVPDERRDEYPSCNHRSCGV